jgi:DNA-binding winged helix-turn-helix (wHTH) protein
LLQTVWGYSGETRTRTVDVHVSRLRKKLHGRARIAIHTVVNQGYVLEFSAAAPGEATAGAVRKASTNGKAFSARV